jgi:hypothetical protein
MSIIREEADKGTLIVSGCNSIAHRFRRLSPDATRDRNGGLVKHHTLEPVVPF